MKPEEAFWAGLVLVGTAVEFWALRHDDDWTLSRVTRRALRCHTKAGRMATLVAIGSGSAWFANHLLNIPPVDL